MVPNETGPLQATRDPGESDHEHWLVGRFDVTYMRDNSYGHRKPDTVQETVAFGPDQTYVPFHERDVVGAAFMPGSCSKYNPVS